MTLNDINKLIAPLARRVVNMVARGTMKASDDSARIQTVQMGVLRGEVRDRCERFQQFGFTGRPLPPDGDGAAEAVVVFVGGNRDHPLVIALDDRRHRKTGLQEGESAVYNAGGEYIHLKMDGTIEVVARTAVTVTAPEVTVTASTKVTLDTPVVEATGDMTVAGNVTAGGSVTAAGNISTTGGGITATGGDVEASGISLKEHVHGGVQPGSGDTGAAK